MTTLLKNIAFIGLLFQALIASGQSIMWNGSEQPLNITPDVFVAEDKGGQLSAAEVASAAFAPNFARSDKKVLDFKFTHSWFWVKFSVKNETQEPLVLEVAQALLDTVQLCFQDSAGQWQSMQSGYSMSIYKKPIVHSLHAFSLPLNTETFYLHYQSAEEPVPLKLWSASGYEAKKTDQTIAYGVYIGIMLIIILLNLFLFGLMRRFTYIHYAVLVSMYLWFSSILEGYLSYFVQSADLMFWFNLNPVVNLFIGTSYCYLFLEVKKYHPRLSKIVVPFLAFLFAYIFLHWLLPLSYLIPFNQFLSLIVVFSQTGIGISVGRKGNRLGYYYAATYFIFFILCAVEIVYIHTGKPAYLFAISHVSFGILFEALSLAYLLVKRFQWERAEMHLAKEMAQKELLEKTLENEKIVREQNVVLEATVTRRTDQLQKANQDLGISLQNVERERQKSESLLLNILPAATALELKENGFTKPKIYPSVTVLITDFKDFTKSTVDMPPERLVSDLNHCFSAFDQIVQRHGVEKIKTIGDAYLAASGLPLPNEHHAINVLNAACEMQAFILQWKAEQEAQGRTAWDVRIGVHTGPVVAGVVGTHKFAYDIWGDTVNTAARMESSSVPGKINISATTYALVQEQFVCVSRGKIEAKGKGELEMFWVEKRK